MLAKGATAARLSTEALRLSAAPPGKNEGTAVDSLAGSDTLVAAASSRRVHRSRHDVCRVCDKFNGPAGLCLVPVVTLYRDSIVILCLAVDERGQRR